MNVETSWLLVGRRSRNWFAALVCGWLVVSAGGRANADLDEAQVRPFLERHCAACHAGDEAAAGLDLKRLDWKLDDRESFQRWVKVFDRVSSGQMPPKDAPQPPVGEGEAWTRALRGSLLDAERRRIGAGPRTGLRRLTRAEYENTIRDLFDMPGIALQGELPADGSAHGFDKNSDALDVSHVNLAKYLESADRILDMAIATRPVAPAVKTQRISLANPPGFVAHVLLHGDGVLLKNKKPDPEFPPAGEQMHLDQGAHERMGSFHNGASVGLFRHEDESFHPYFNEFVTIYPGRYRVKTSLWSFQWDRGQVLPSRGVEAARLSIVQLTGDGRGGGHPSTVLAYFDAPSMNEQVHELTTWLNPRETIGFNAASLVSGHTRGKQRAMGYVGPGIACDWLDVEGPLHETWPPTSHRVLFGDLPLREFKPEEHPGVRPPKHVPARQQMFMGKNTPDREEGVWTVLSEQPLEDADRLLASFLPRLFRRPVGAEVRRQYAALVERGLESGECFETAMRRAYRAAFCSPDFLYRVEAAGERAGEVDDDALAARLSYFLWNSGPDETLRLKAAMGELRNGKALRGEAERLLRDPKSQRFVVDFLGQWLRLRQIAANDPDKKLYPEFSPYLQDSMVAETQAYFRELLDHDLDARHLVRSDFAMINEKLAVHYGIPGVSGSKIRRVAVPADSARGPFLTQAALLKITANGTTTSPVPRGAFVMARLLGQPPEPPPPNVPAVEPDVRGATTIREQLQKHRELAVCASCHSRIDPPGFALEAFDVIGGLRTRYRSIGAGDPAPRGAIDPMIGISFRLGPPVDSSGELPSGEKFGDVLELQRLLAADARPLLKNVAQQWTIYATGRDVAFSDREMLEQVLSATERQGGGLRTLLLELIDSPLFRMH